MTTDFRQSEACRRRQRGTATIEFVLIVPLLALVVGLTFFFGWALMRKHQVIVADRYSTWQRIETGAWPSEGRINQVVFNNKASSVSLDAQDPLSETLYDLAGEAAGRGPRAGNLADEILLQRFPRGAMASVSATFDPRRTLWSQFTGAIHHTHGRQGITWRRDEANCWGTLRDLYYSDLDTGLQRVPSPSDRMAAMIRGLYLAAW